MVLIMWITIVTILVLFFCLPVKFKIQIKNYNYSIKLYIFSNLIVFKKSENLKECINKIKAKKENKLKKTKINKKNNKYIKIIIKCIIEIFNKLKIEKFEIVWGNIAKYNYLLGVYLIGILNSTLYSYLAFKNTNIKNINIELELKNIITNKINNNFKFNCIISIKPVNIIYIIFKVIIERGIKYGRTSYRKFNEYSNGIFRKYD